MRSRGEIGGPRLAEDLAYGIEEDHHRIRTAQAVDRRRYRFRAQDHPRSPTVRRVVDGPVAADPPLAEVVDPDRGQALLLDAPRDALGERALEHRREEGQDVDLEGHASLARGAPGPSVA